MYDDWMRPMGTDRDHQSHALESARGAMASTVRPWDRQRAQGRQRRNREVAPVVTASIRLAPRRGIRSPERIARTISSRGSL